MEELTTQEEARLRSKAKHRKSRKGCYREKEKMCRRGDGWNLVNSQCVYDYVIKKCRKSTNIILDNQTYTDDPPTYFMADYPMQSIYFYDNNMRQMYSFCFSRHIKDFFTDDQEVCSWAPYQEAYKKYTGEYLEETLDRIYPVRYRVTKDFKGYKNEKKYKRYKKLQRASKKYGKTYQTKKLRTLEKQELNRLKKVENLEDYDYIFPKRSFSDHVY